MLHCTVARPQLLSVDLQRRLMSMFGVWRKLKGNFSISLTSESDVQWATVAESRPIGPVSQADLDNVAVLSGQDFADAILSLHC